MSEIYSAIQNCRLCKGTNLKSVLDLGTQALTGRFPKPGQDIPAGPLELVQCADCGLTQLQHDYDLGEMYGETYGYRSGLNQSMVAHLKKWVDTLCDRVLLAPGDVVLDIGANDGTTLGFYPEHTTRIGIDPAAGKFGKFYKPRIKRVVDFFDKDKFMDASGGRKAKIITTISMFYDLPDPLAFSQDVAACLADDGVWLMEQSHLPAMLRAVAYDTVCHEHLEYYALRQIEWIADQLNLKIIDLQENKTNGGSFAVMLARKLSPWPERTNTLIAMRADEEALGLYDGRAFHTFRTQIMSAKDQLQSTLLNLKAQGKTVYGYGASTKGNVVLQYCGITPDLLPKIAEVNPDKFGHVTPGTHIPIVDEKMARAENPDYFMVLPWHFRDMIVEKEQDYLNAGGKLLFPLPAVEVVSA